MSSYYSFDSNGFNISIEYLCYNITAGTYDIYIFVKNQSLNINSLVNNYKLLV